VNCSEEKAINDPKCQSPLGANDAKESLVLTGNQVHETSVEAIEIERPGRRVAMQSLYRRGRQAER